MFQHNRCGRHVGCRASDNNHPLQFRLAKSTCRKRYFSDHVHLFAYSLGKGKTSGLDEAYSRQNRLYRKRLQIKSMFTLTGATTFARSEANFQDIDLTTAALLRQSRDSFGHPHRAADVGAVSMSATRAQSARSFAAGREKWPPVTLIMLCEPWFASAMEHSLRAHEQNAEGRVKQIRHAGMLWGLHVQQIDSPVRLQVFPRVTQILAIA